MPILMWKHKDCCNSPGHLSGSPVCHDGLQRGIPAGWHRYMYESMAAFQYAYGLKPIGPHIKLVTEFMVPLRAQCTRCDGGVIQMGEGWRKCSSCEATGGYWTCTDEQLKEARGKVLAAYPDAAVPETPSWFLGAILVLDTKTNTVIGWRE